MRDLIFTYLEKAGGPVRATRVLLDVLRIHVSDEGAASRLLKAIVMKDPRFGVEGSFWSLRQVASSSRVFDFGNVASLYLETGLQPGCRRGALHHVRRGTVRTFELTARPARSGIRAIGRARKELEGLLLAIWNPAVLSQWNRILRSCALPEWSGETLSVRDLAVRIFNAAPALNPEDLANTLGLRCSDSIVEMARFLSSCLALLLERVPVNHKETPDEIHKWIEEGRPKIDFSRFGFGPEFLGSIPACPGVYIMRNRTGTVIYVGKSRNLRSRVRSYFTPRTLRDRKIERIHRQLHLIEIVPTESEVEALLSEMRLIKDYSPLINLQSEVHEKPAQFGREKNLLLLVPRKDPGKAEIYFLRAGIFLREETVRLKRPPSQRILRRIRSVFFSSRSPARGPRQPWEMELVFRWLAANRRRVNYVDVDEAGTFDAVASALAAYLDDPSGLTEKVYYR